MKSGVSDSFLEFKEKINELDIYSIDIAFYNSFDSYDALYKKFMNVDKIRSENAEFQETFKNLRSHIRYIRKESVILKQSFDEVVKNEGRHDFKAQLTELLARFEETYPVMLSILDEEYNKLNKLYEHYAIDITKMNDLLTNTSKDYVAAFFNELKSHDVSFKGFCSKKDLDERLSYIIDQVDKIIEIKPNYITCYHFRNFVKEIPNRNDLMFDYSIIACQYYKLAEKVLDALMFIFCEKDGLPSTIGNTKKRFIYGKSLNFSGITIKDKITFITNDVEDRSIKLNKLIKTERPKWEEFKDAINSWHNNRNAYIHSLNISTFENLNKPFDECSSIIYRFLELAFIIGVR